MSFLQFVLFLIPLLGFFLFWAFVFKRGFEFLFVFSFSLIVIVLYLAALGDQVPLAASSLCYLGWVFFPASIGLIYKTKRFTFKDLFTPGVADFLSYGMFGWAKMRTAKFGGWDEFSH